MKKSTAVIVVEAKSQRIADEVLQAVLRVIEDRVDLDEILDDMEVQAKVYINE